MPPLDSVRYLTRVTLPSRAVALWRTAAPTMSMVALGPSVSVAFGLKKLSNPLCLLMALKAAGPARIRAALRGTRIRRAKWRETTTHELKFPALCRCPLVPLVVACEHPPGACVCMQASTQARAQFSSACEKPPRVLFRMQHCMHTQCDPPAHTHARPPRAHLGRSRRANHDGAPRLRARPR